MGLNDREKAEFLVSTLQGDPSKAIMSAQHISGDLSFKEICSRLESRYEGDFSTFFKVVFNLNKIIVFFQDFVCFFFKPL